jgi:hypothetical protein
MQYEQLRLQWRRRKKMSIKANKGRLKRNNKTPKRPPLPGSREDQEGRENPQLKQTVPPNKQQTQQNNREQGQPASRTRRNTNREKPGADRKVSPDVVGIWLETSP